MSINDDNRVPGPPPDDFSETAPNIRIGRGDPEDADWAKTNYNIPRQPAADDWGKTVTNIKPIDTSDQDFGKTFIPGARPPVPPTPEWGMTDANVRINPADLGSLPEDFASGASMDEGKTVPYFRLPEAEKAKHQKPPPTPTEKAENEAREKAAAGGIPGWFWVVAGLFAMFMFAVVVLGLVAFFLSRPTSFEAVVREAPPGSRILVDDQQWGTTSDDGTRRLTNLKLGRRTIKIVHPTFECRPMDIEGQAGVTPEPLIARCTEIEAAPSDDCGNFQPGEFDKAERCYNSALAALPDPFTAEDLVRALNILIINFESGSYAVPEVRLAALQKGAAYIQKLPPAIVLEVGGHTDNDGTDASNQILSENRAKAVKDRLVAFGVRPEALQTRGYGAGSPKFDNATEQGKFLNRRIAYSVVRK